ncbi:MULTISPECIES: LysR family transcriptional regulator [Stenotrophomonas]|uniref:LysR family transcriptional regulator n=1 Tax=Stenotrophomonas maltophilia TaxID=40324 RepID=A0A2J0U6Z8_STEMA|nr:LysR family transcriptional regulator [Stenotrophomonas sp. SMYL82]PJL24717.1 LysR family transcriptional regulator [Stenotrophomonas maltophilia]HDS1149152.1 LysR family transcriptional regulator [Stenotrophomonas maltophilia]HDS1162184.1 LysR family transcriptional regulator [Stenotrophomonas maltophilia]
MSVENYDQLALFALVARERSFTRAAAQLGMSQPALSRSMRQLEERLGVRLLARTTRSVSPTEAGEQLLRVIAPRFEEIDSELAQLNAYRDKPAGRLRITAGEHAALTVMQPVLGKLLPANPDLNIEVIVDYGLTDIVAEGFDAGIRMGEQVARDMIAVRVGPDLRMAVVGSPGYFQRHPKPKSPHDLTRHNCITIRLPTHGGIFAWEFEKKGQELKVRFPTSRLRDPGECLDDIRAGPRSSGALR